MKRRRIAIITAALMLGSTLALAGQALASHNNDYQCVGQDNGPDDAVEVCLTQDGAEDDTAGPECEEDGRYDRSNGVEANVEQGDLDVGADAEGKEECYKYCFFTCLTGEEEGIELRVYAQDESSFDTTQIEAEWIEDEDGCDTVIEIDSDQADQEEEISLAEETGDGCPAGPPPNPGWGELYPAQPEQPAP